MTPWLSDPDLDLYVGDVRDILPTLEAGSVDCVATSPPFFGLRDYGEDRQIGLEQTPEEWVDALVGVFRECRRIMRPAATLWIEVGDSYSAGGLGAGGSEKQVSNAGANLDIAKKAPPGFKLKDLLLQPFMLAMALRADGWYLRQVIVWAKPNAMPESVRDRCTTAHSYVLLLSKAPRYFFDADAIAEPAEWARWGDQTVPKYEGTETASGWMQPKSKHELAAIGGRTTNGQKGRTDERRGFDNRLERVDGRKNARSVWQIPTSGYPGAHFATFPEKLVERMLLAGCPEAVCGTCGKPKGAETVRSPLGNGPVNDPTMLTGRKGMNRERRDDEGVREITKAEQRDYAQQLRESPHREEMAAEAGPAFAHYIRTDESGARPIPPDLLGDWIMRGWLVFADPPAEDCGHDNYRPGVVLDPFLGSGTTALVARRHGRRTIGVELNADYAAMAAERLNQLSLLA